MKERRGNSEGSDASAAFPIIQAAGAGDTIFTEQFKVLRAKLEHRIETSRQAGGNPLKVLAVTSAVSGEGKTLVSLNLAVSFALAGRWQVALVDIDMRKSDLKRILRLTDGPGLRDHLGGQASLGEISMNSLHPNLRIIPAGERDDSAGELLAGERFRTFLASLREAYDIILLDTPPILPVADSLSLRNLIDGYLIVARLGHVHVSMLRQAFEEIGEKHIVGVVLNGAEIQSHKYYQRYYGKYYKKAES